MHLLLDLPTVLAVDIMSNWLEVNETVQLDTAFCETATRHRFAEILSSCTVGLPLPVEIHGCHCKRPESDKLVIWSVKRNVRVDKLDISMYSDLALYSGYLITNGATVTRIGLATGLRYEATKDLVGSIATYCCQLKSFDLSVLEGFSIVLKSLLTQCTKLQELRLTDCELDHQSLQGLTCPNLHTLVLVRLQSAELVAALLQTAPNLKTLSLESCSLMTEDNNCVSRCISSAVTALELIEVTDEELRNFVDACPHVVSITLFDGTYEELTPTVSTIEYVAKRLTSLASVDLSYCNASDVHLRAFLDNCADTLTSLNCTGCGVSISNNVEAALKRCTKLTHFACAYNRDCKDTDFSSFAGLTDLQFYIEYHHASLLESIAQHCRKLVRLTLNLHGAVHSSFDGLDNVVANNPHLGELVVSAPSFYNRTGFFCEERLKALEKVRPRLIVTINVPKYMYN